MIRSILIDDEPLALKNLGAIIQKHCPQLSVVATAGSVTEAVEKIGETDPDLVFLDIELAGETSFNLLRRWKQRRFELIFVTAYDQFGIQAIKHEAVDYILKPIHKKELIAAIEKASAKIYRQRQGPVPEQPKAIQGRLALPTLEGLLFVDTASVMYCESEGRYTRFHLEDESKKILVSRNLGEYEALLPASTFIRIHHHSIVNINYVHRYIRGRGGYVVLKNGKNLPVSSRKKDDFFEKML